MGSLGMQEHGWVQACKKKGRLGLSILRSLGRKHTGMQGRLCCTHECVKKGTAWQSEQCRQHLGGLYGGLMRQEEVQGELLRHGGRRLCIALCGLWQVGGGKLRRVERGGDVRRELFEELCKGRQTGCFGSATGISSPDKW